MAHFDLRKGFISIFIAISLIFPFPKMGNAFCFKEAGKEYGLSALLLRAIASVESSMDPAAINKANRNGSADSGLMQINSSWHEVLGPTSTEALSDPCFNVRMGAWVLSGCMKKFGKTWRAVGCYNTNNEKRREVYAWKVFERLEELKAQPKLEKSVKTKDRVLNAKR